MELWIRSQDRKHLVHTDCLTVSGKNDEFYICDTFIGHIAKYKTEERALEVLDEIQKKLMLIDVDGNGIEYIIIKNLASDVYEMPKE